MPLKRRLLFVWLAGALGCSLLVPPGPSAVARGRYFSTGNPNYDEFFVRLHRMQVELKAGPETLASIRADLARGLELAPPSDTAALRAALTAKAGQMSGRGTALAVDRGRESGSRMRLTVAGTPAETDRALVKTLEDALARLGELRERFSTWQKELEWLPQTGVALDGSIEAAFVGQSRATRNDVHENLADAQKVIALMTARMREIDTNSAELEALFTSAFGESKAAPPPPEPAKPRPRPAPRPPAAAAPAAPAGDEPPPAPKPKQGTARPDFEP
jgi:hypothetical protein